MNSNNDIDLSMLIKIERTRNKMHQSDLADLAECDATTIGNYENGRIPVQIKLLFTILDKLNIGIKFYRKEVK